MLRAAGNELRVVFRSPIIKDLHRVGEAGYRLPAANDKEEGTSPYTRKAPQSFGWDWGPRFVTAGIWKPIRLEAWDDVRLVDVFVRQIELGEAAARLEADVEILGGDGVDGEVTIEIEVDGSSVASVDIPAEQGVRALASRKELAVAKAELLAGRDPASVFLDLRLTSSGETLASNRRFFVVPKELRLVPPRIATEIESARDGFTVELSTDTLAKSVRLTYEPDDGPSATTTSTWCRGARSKCTSDREAR